MTPVTFPGAPGNTGSQEQDSPIVDMIGTRASYVQVMGMRLVMGRAFDVVRQDGRQEVIIDRHLAERFFPNANPIGMTIPWPGSRISPDYQVKPAAALTIVGVVEQARMHDVHQDGRPQIYVRTEDWGFRPLSFVVRTAVNPEAIIPEARAALRKVEPRVAMGDVKTMEEIVGDLLRPQRASAVAIGAFALGALLLATMGLFGIVSNSVTRRRHEIAVRLAIGANHQQVLRLIMGEGALLVGIGVLIGLPGIYVAGRLMRGMLFGTSPADPLTLTAVAVALGVVTMAACYVPARHVLSIDPSQWLRGE
jgi:putative ABC transport system permease protein